MSPSGDSGATPRSAARFHVCTTLVFVPIAFGGFLPICRVPLAAAARTEICIDVAHYVQDVAG